MSGGLNDPQTDRVNPAGNERLTAAVGVLVLAPVIVEAASVLLGVHTFMSLHVFVGLALIPPVLLKLASTGWRFARYLLHAQPRLSGPGAAADSDATARAAVRRGDGGSVRQRRRNGPPARTRPSDRP